MYTCVKRRQGIKWEWKFDSKLSFSNISKWKHPENLDKENGNGWSDENDAANNAKILYRIYDITQLNQKKMRGGKRGMSQRKVSRNGKNDDENNKRNNMMGTLTRCVKFKDTTQIIENEK